MIFFIIIGFLIIYILGKRFSGYTTEEIEDKLKLLNTLLSNASRFVKLDPETYNKFIKEIDEFKISRNKNIVNFLNLINPIIENYMKDNSIYMLIDKKNVFIASKDYDITNNLIELIDKQIKDIEIK